MGENKIDYERCKIHHIFNDVIEEIHNGGTFLMSPAERYIEAEAVMNGGIVATVPKKISYNMVINFNFPEAIETLDLTWMNPEDVFCLSKNDAFKNIKELIINIDNVSWSNVPHFKDSEEKLNIVVCGNSKEENIAILMKNFKDFIDENRDEIKSIKFEGFDPIVEDLLRQYPKVNNISIIENQNENKKHL